MKTSSWETKFPSQVSCHHLLNNIFRGTKELLFLSVPCAASKCWHLPRLLIPSSGPQFLNLVPRAAVSAAAGNWLKMDILRSHHRPISNSGGGAWRCVHQTLWAILMCTGVWEAPLQSVKWLESAPLKRWRNWSSVRSAQSRPTRRPICTHIWFQSYLSHGLCSQTVYTTWCPQPLSQDAVMTLA